MSANQLAITKSYGDGLPWTEAIVDTIKADIESWAGDTVDNLNQLRLDLFGSSYSFDNDGSANNSTAFNVGQTITPTATIHAIDIVATALTTGTAIDVSDANALTTGTLINVVSNSSDTGTRTLLQLTNDNSSATGATPFAVQQDAAVRAAYINQNGNSTGLLLDKDGTGAGVPLVIDDEGTGNAISSASAGASSIALRSVMENASYGASAIQVEVTRTANSAYSFFGGYSGGTGDLEINLRGEGTILSDNAATTPADYAEMFECEDRKGIEPGFFVTLGKTGCIKKANASDPYILGVVSGAPAILGDSGWGRWPKKYLKDEFGRYVLDDAGDRKLNPKWNPKLGYVARSDRDEWVAVGLLGKLIVRTSEDITSDFVDVGCDGLAINGGTYRVLEVIRQHSNDPDKTGYGVVRVVFRGAE